MLNGYILRYPDCILNEVQPTFDLLSSTLRVLYIDLDNVSAHLNADFLVIPGGSCDLAINHDALRQWINKLNVEGKPIGGICNGALVLADAGILNGRPCTHTAHPKYAPVPEFKELLDVASVLFGNAQYIDEDVVVSQNIVTAKPWASTGFAQAMLGLIAAKSS